MDVRTQRQDVRLQVGALSKGVVFLRGRGVPSVACPLIELSESGCRCVAPISKLDESTAAKLRTSIEVGRTMAIDISAPPHLPGIHLDIEIKHSGSNESADVELGLQFVNVEQDERALLKEALHAFAKDKLQPVHGNVPALPQPVKLTESGFLRLVHPINAEPQLVTQNLAPVGDLDSRPAESDARKESRSALAVKVWNAPPVVHAADDPYRGKRLGEILKELGRISDDRIAEAHAASSRSNEKFGQYLLRGGWISPIDLCSALSLQSGLPMIDLADFDIEPELAASFGYLTLLRHEFIPFHDSPELICLAATHPIEPSTLTDLEQRCKKKIRVFLCEDDVIMKTLHALQPTKERKLRRRKRFPLNVPISFRFFNRQQGTYGEKPIAGTTLDVSESGVMLEVSEDIKGRGTCVQISFALDPNRVDALCSVRYVKDSKGAKDKKADSPEVKQVVGLQFMDISPDHMAQLKEICVRAGMWALKDRRT